MELKYYRKEGDDYILLPTPNTSEKTKKVCMQIAMISSSIALLAGAAGYFYELYKNGSAFPGTLLIGMITAGLALFIRLNTVQLRIQPARRMVLIKKAKHSKEYSFDQFLNFQTTQIRVYGLIPVMCALTIFFDDKGKNVAIPLSKNKEHIINEIVRETKILMGIS